MYFINCKILFFAICSPLNTSKCVRPHTISNWIYCEIHIHRPQNENEFWFVCCLRASLAYLMSRICWTHICNVRGMTTILVRLCNRMKTKQADLARTSSSPLPPQTKRKTSIGCGSGVEHVWIVIILLQFGCLNYVRIRYNMSSICRVLCDGDDATVFCDGGAMLYYIKIISICHVIECYSIVKVMHVVLMSARIVWSTSERKSGISHFLCT